MTSFKVFLGTSARSVLMEKSVVKVKGKLKHLPSYNFRVELLRFVNSDEKMKHVCIRWWYPFLWHSTLLDTILGNGCFLIWQKSWCSTRFFHLQTKHQTILCSVSRFTLLGWKKSVKTVTAKDGIQCKKKSPLLLHGIKGRESYEPSSLQGDTFYGAPINTLQKNSKVSFSHNTTSAFHPIHWDFFLCLSSSFSCFSPASLFGLHSSPFFRARHRKRRPPDISSNTRLRWTREEAGDSTGE